MKVSHRSPAILPRDSLIAGVLIIVGCMTEAISGHQPPAAPTEREVVLRISRSDGSPASFAKVATHAGLMDGKWTFSSRGLSSNKCDKFGAVKIQFGETDRGPLVIYATSEGKQNEVGVAEIGVAELRVHAQAGSPIKMRLDNSCLATGRVCKTGSVGRTIGTYVIQVKLKSGKEFMTLILNGGSFELALPPGQFSLEAMAAETYNVRQAVSIAGGARRIEVPLIELPPTKLALPAIPGRPPRRMIP